VFQPIAICRGADKLNTILRPVVVALWRDNFNGID
jgi:hypothetical protein